MFATLYCEAFKDKKCPSKSKNCFFPVKSSFFPKLKLRMFREILLFRWLSVAIFVQFAWKHSISENVRQKSRKKSISQKHINRFKKTGTLKFFKKTNFLRRVLLQCFKFYWSRILVQKKYDYVEKANFVKRTLNI